ncbi:hypothetical protein BD779DRAFT_1521115, partial [Infundibulicybe gibba]
SQNIIVAASIRPDGTPHLQDPLKGAGADDKTNGLVDEETMGSQDIYGMDTGCGGGESTVKASDSTRRNSSGPIKIVEELTGDSKYIDVSRSFLAQSGLVG